MLMQQRLGLKLAQKPVLTQSLRQLVKLLALNKLELKEEIAQELLENPVLEAAVDADGTSTGETPDASTSTEASAAGNNDAETATAEDAVTADGETPDALLRLTLKLTSMTILIQASTLPSRLRP